MSLEDTPGPVQGGGRETRVPAAPAGALRAGKGKPAFLPSLGIPRSPASCAPQVLFVSVTNSVIPRATTANPVRRAQSPPEVAMDDDIELDEATRRELLQELRNPEKMRAICEGLRRMTAKLTSAELERAKHIDSFWLPTTSPWWPERLAYEPRKIRSGQ